MDILDKYYNLFVELNNKHKDYCEKVFVEANNKYKFNDKYSTIKEIKDNFKKNNSWYIDEYKGKLYLRHDADNTFLKIVDVCVLYNFFEKMRCSYIRNISVLKTKPDCWLKCLFSRNDWESIQNVLNLKDSYNKFNIIKVDNLSSYVTKLVIMKKAIVHLNPSHGFYTMIETVDKDLLLVSDLNFVVTDTTCMSFNILNVKEINIENINIADMYVGPITTLNRVFADNPKLERIYFKNFNTYYIQDFSYMFAECHQLKSINLDGFKMDNAINLDGMFRNCGYLTNVKISSWVLPKAKIFSSMFFRCVNLQTLDISKWCLSEQIKTTDYMFYGCFNLRQVLLPKNINLFNNNARHVFSGCYNFEGIF